MLYPSGSGWRMNGTSFESENILGYRRIISGFVRDQWKKVTEIFTQNFGVIFK